MTDSQPTQLARWEALLRSPRALVAIGGMVVLGLSAVLTLQLTDMLEDRGREVDTARVFVGQLVHWGLWALLAAPIVVFARWSWPRLRPWPLALALQFALAPAVGYGHEQLRDSLLRVLVSRASADDAAADRRLGLADDPSEEPWRAGPEDLSGDRPSGGPPGGVPGEPPSGPQSGPPGGPPGAPGERGPDRWRPGQDVPPGRRPGPDSLDARGPGQELPESRRPGTGRSRSQERGRQPRRPPPWGPVSGALTYVALLALSAGAQTWLRSRDEERRVASLELAASRLRGELDRARLDRLSAQLRPHFLFNTLHAVGSLVREERRDDALATLAAVGDLLRASLDTRGRQEVTLAEELASAAGFLAIEALRLGERLVVQRELDPDCDGALVPALVLLPLLENAVIHAAEPRVEPTHLTLRVERAGDELRLTVADDGPGFPPQVQAQGQAVEADRPHIGLANTRSRLVGLYGDAGRLELGPSPAGGAQVTVSLPWHTEPLGGSLEDLEDLEDLERDER